MLNPESTDPAELAAKFVNYTSRHVFLTGKAGTGKTTFLRRLIDLTHKRAVVAAPTGIAAINASGVTIHSLFQLPFGTFLPRTPAEIGIDEQTHFNTPKSILHQVRMQMSGLKRKVLVEMDLLIIDEVSMLRADLLDAIDTVLRFVRKQNSSFGGVQLLFIGDLHQLPPIVKNEEQRLLSQVYQSPFFFDAQVLQNDPPVYIELEKIYRQQDDVFIRLLNNLRNNTVQPDDMAVLQKHFNEGFKPPAHEKYITLTTHNRKADAINKERLEALSSRSFFYKAGLEGEFSEGSFPAEKELVLKLGAQVMFIKNDPSGEQRFFNGKLATVTALEHELVEVQAEGDGERIVVERYLWKNNRYTTDKVSGEIKEELIGTFAQYPLRLAWAITVHKSQGLTFERAIVDIGNAFAPGQVYVALSRLSSLQGLVLTSSIPGGGIRQDPNVSHFARTKQDHEHLRAQVAGEMELFLKDYLLRSFDLASLDNLVYEHVHSYTKDINRSAKQKHQKWAQKLLKSVMAMRGHATRFLAQISRIAEDGSQQGRDLLMERVIAAEQYFSAGLSAFSEDIFERMELVKQNKQVLEFLSELLELESAFYEQYKKIRKAPALLRAVLENREFSREDADRLIDVSTRGKRMLRVFAMEGTQDFTLKKVSRPRSGKAKSKTAKSNNDTKPNAKSDTKAISLELFTSGKSIPEIAKEREMVVGTIEGHLAHYVEEKKIKGEDVLGKNKLEAISEAIKMLKTTQMNPIREHLGKNYSFGEIKIGVAAHKVKS